MNKYIGPDFIHFTGRAEIDGRILLLTFFDEKKIVCNVCNGRAEP
jgi:hypothetical protein